jgi:hypothetical protein
VRVFCSVARQRIREPLMNRFGSDGADHQGLEHGHGDLAGF